MKKSADSPRRRIIRTSNGVKDPEYLDIDRRTGESLRRRRAMEDAVEAMWWHLEGKELEDEAKKLKDKASSVLQLAMSKLKSEHLYLPGRAKACLVTSPRSTISVTMLPAILLDMGIQEKKVRRIMKKAISKTESTFVRVTAEKENKDG